MPPIISPWLRRLVIDAVVMAAVNFIIGQAFQILREDLETMRKQEDTDV